MPKYQELSNTQWNDKINAGLTMLENCQLCPNRCSVNRVKGGQGYCKSGFFLKISSAFAHRGEEPPLSGCRGSGTIFFTGCTMRCAYCQNYPISQQSMGVEVPFEKAADYMMTLQGEGCHNINLVTPTHFIPQIIIALHKAVGQGLNIPIVYNTSGYETAEALALLDQIVDIYLPDMRYGKNETAKKYSHVDCYVDYNRAAIKAMASQAGELILDDEGIAVRGLIIRMLILPGLLDELYDNIRFLAQELSIVPYISLMSQYFPTWKALDMPEINRPITEHEFHEGFSYLHKFGLDKGFVQED